MKPNPTGPPKGPGKTPEERAKQRAWFDAFYAKLERPSPPRRKRTGEQAQRMNTRARLRRLGADIQAAANTLERLHTEGCIWPSYPLLSKEWEGRGRSPGIGKRFARANEEAAQGCADSAEFVAEWEPLFLLCEHLRHERLPEWKAKPLEVTPEMRARTAALMRQPRREWDAWDKEWSDGAE